MYLNLVQMFYLIKFYTNQPTILQILGKLIKNFDLQLVLTIPFSLRFNLSEIILAFLCIVDIFFMFFFVEFLLQNMKCPLIFLLI